MTSFPSVDTYLSTLFVVSLLVHVFMYIFFLFYFLLGLDNMGFYYLIQIKIDWDWLIYLKNNSVRFHLDPIWNNGVLGFPEERSHAARTRRTRWAAIWDQFLIQNEIDFMVTRPTQLSEVAVVSQQCVFIVAYVSHAWSTYEHTLIVGFGVLKPPIDRYLASGVLTVSIRWVYRRYK